MFHEDVVCARMHTRELFTAPRGPFVSAFTCTEGLPYMPALCIVSGICIFKMYIIHMNDATPLVSVSGSQTPSPILPVSPPHPTPPFIN